VKEVKEVKGEREVMKIDKMSNFKRK